MTSRVQLVTLASVPATVATGAAIATRTIFHQTAITEGIAALAGLLALVAVFAVSPETQKTLRMWIRYRAEHRIAAATSYQIRHWTRAAICGRRWTKAGANDIRQAAAEFSKPQVGLHEVMLISRIDRHTVAGQQQNDCEPSSSSGGNDTDARAPLEIVRNQAPSIE
jgi:hypothetical protein